MLVTSRLVTLLLLLPFFYACKDPLRAKDGTIFKTPADYNEYIISRQTRIIRNIIELGNQIKVSPDTAYTLLDKYSTQTDSVIEDIKGMPPFRSDSAFRDAAIRSFTFYKTLFNDHYRTILKLRMRGGEATEEGVNDWMEVMEKIKREEEGLDKQLHNAQNDFAKKYSMKMRPSDIQKELKKKN
jgi:hypothetical protein